MQDILNCFSFLLDVIDGENHVRHIQTPIELLTCVYFCSDRRSRLSYIDNKPMFIPQLITSFFFSYFHPLVFFLIVVYVRGTRLEAYFPCYNHFIQSVYNTRQFSLKLVATWETDFVQVNYLLASVAKYTVELLQSRLIA